AGELTQIGIPWRHNELYHHNLGEWLADAARPGDVIAVTSAGAIPYLSGLETLDMLGLSDAHIAREGTDIAGLGVPGHERFDNDYVLDRAPEWIVLDLLPPQLFEGTTPQLHHEADLLQRPEFWEAYTLISPPVQGNCVFHRRDDAEGLSRLPEASWRETWHFLWPGLRERVQIPAPPPAITGGPDIG
ncbi:hypothetical protein KAU45_10525, partial [bacterium]|nr:hypothetical protein [bacterium]